MAYRNFHRRARPTPRVITVKYAGKCACCGAEIKAGETATFYPAGTIASITEGKIGHIGGLEGTGARCTAELRKQAGLPPAPRHCNHEFRTCTRGCGAVCAAEVEHRAVNDYAGDGLDERYEDDCARQCGLL